MTTMEGRRVLVVYYSRSGATRAAAHAIRSELGSAIERIVDSKRRDGALGYLRCLVDVASERPARLRPMTLDAAAYDLVIVGTPVWASAVSAPVRTYLAENARRLRSVAFFCTYGGNGSDRAFRQMSELTGQEPIATLALRNAETRDDATVAARVRSFAAVLTQALTSSPHDGLAA